MYNLHDIPSRLSNRYMGGVCSEVHHICDKFATFEVHTSKAQFAIDSRVV